LHDTHSSDYRGQTGEVRGSWSSGNRGRTHRCPNHTGRSRRCQP
jgi:hypothetical protein